MGNVSVITGAAGLVGSHVAEHLCGRGDAVRALVRPTSDTSFLRTLPVEIVVADLDDLARYPQALANAGTVYHCAAFVRDWGTWNEFHAGTVATTANLVKACREAGAGRIVHVSSVSVYGNPPPTGGLITEDSPLGQHLWRGDQLRPRKNPRGRGGKEVRQSRGRSPELDLRPARSGIDPASPKSCVMGRCGLSVAATIC